MGFGFGRGAQWRRTLSPRWADAGWDFGGQRLNAHDERDSLENQASILREHLDLIQRRLNELQKSNEAKN
jgi:hypothetical protein